MFQHIMVPLDGSVLAEQALPAAARIARRTGGTVHLLQVLAPVPIYDPYLAQTAAYLNELGEEEDEAAKYLERVAHTKTLEGVKTQREIRTGVPAQEILIYAQAAHTDLIVLCSHGYTGLTRWALGSVAQKIARHSPIPTLILHQESADTLAVEEARPACALVALDGSALAEAVLEPAAHLTALLSPQGQAGVLHLVRIVKPPSEKEERKFHAYDINIREYNQREAEEYLQAVTKKLAEGLAKDLNLRISRSAIEQQDVAAALIETAESGKTTDAQPPERHDLLAIATHGRSGIQRWTVGSVAERVLDGTKLPLLVVRPKTS
ncbi:MAG: universal stress protein [Ktedonobacteraceae bacterium]|nr:universal stress protein [Ktedonobacteraceae bacterium]